MSKLKTIEIADWNTLLDGSELHILSAGFSRDNEWGLGIKNEKYYEADNTHFHNPDFTHLVVRVFSETLEAIYQFHFYNVGAFRILDEHGMQEIIEALEATNTYPTFRVRHHGWSKESPLSFHMGTEGGWAYVIMTGWDCVEVLSINEPRVVFESQVEPQEGPLPNPFLDAAKH